MLNRKGVSGLLTLILDPMMQTSKILPLIGEGFIDVLYKIKEVSF